MDIHLIHTYTLESLTNDQIAQPIHKIIQPRYLCAKTWGSIEAIITLPKFRGKNDEAWHIASLGRSRLLAFKRWENANNLSTSNREGRNIVLLRI